MAYNLSRTQSIGDTCTRQDLYDLINTSELTGTGDGGVRAGLVCTAVSEAPPIPVNGDVWWWDKTLQLMKCPINAVGNSACSVWLSMGPDSWEMPVCNVNANTLAKGTVVSFSSNADDGYYAVEPHAAAVSMMGNTYFAKRDMLTGIPVHRGLCGVLQATAVQGQIVPATYKGFTYALVDVALSDYNYPECLAISTTHTGMLSSLVDETYARSQFDSELVVGGLISHVDKDLFTDPILSPCFVHFPWGTVSSQPYNLLNPTA